MEKVRISEFKLNVFELNNLELKMFIFNYSSQIESCEQICKWQSNPKSI